MIYLITCFRKFFVGEGIFFSLLVPLVFWSVVSLHEGLLLLFILSFFPLSCFCCSVGFSLFFLFFSGVRTGLASLQRHHNYGV
ncbi:hypothetical protein BGZ63DRAFT_381044 [Mariannaea sp. PMI_226]|nr:hypothetical protein BGZ63DRAFT_381044 [Mariannaea sp. PMI_226]